MTATILSFPSRTIDRDRLALAGAALKVAMPIEPRDAELDLLLQIGGKLLDNAMDYVAVDCWLVRLDEWEAKDAG